MEKFLVFASEQWLLITALASVVWVLAWLENRRAGASVTPHILTSLVNSEEAVIVDLREKTDFDAGHIVDAINFPFSKWQSQHTGGETELSQYKDRPIVLVCKMGQQSSHVARRLNGTVFNSIYRLAGGLTEWQSAQMPLVKS